MLGGRSCRRMTVISYKDHFVQRRQFRTKSYESLRTGYEMVFVRHDLTPCRLNGGCPSDDDTKTEASCHSRRGTIKTPLSSKAVVFI